MSDTLLAQFVRTAAAAAVAERLPAEIDRALAKHRSEITLGILEDMAATAEDGPGQALELIRIIREESFKRIDALETEVDQIRGQVRASV